MITGTSILPLEPPTLTCDKTSATACLIVSSGASIFVPLFWSPKTARNSRLGGITAPCARRGSFNFGIFGIFQSNPKALPTAPTILSTPPIIPFIALIIRFTPLSIIVTKPFIMPLNMPFMPSQARFQSPVKTPAIKSIRPLKILKILLNFYCL